MFGNLRLPIEIYLNKHEDLSFQGKVLFFIHLLGEAAGGPAVQAVPAANFKEINKETLEKLFITGKKSL